MRPRRRIGCTHYITDRHKLTDPKLQYKTIVQEIACSYLLSNVRWLLNEFKSIQKSILSGNHQNATDIANKFFFPQKCFKIIQIISKWNSQSAFCRIYLSMNGFLVSNLKVKLDEKVRYKTIILRIPKKELILFKESESNIFTASSIHYEAIRRRSVKVFLEDIWKEIFYSIVGIFG